MITQHNPSLGAIQDSRPESRICANDIVMVCDDQSAAIFQVTNANPNNVTIVHNVGTGTPGNCSKGLGYADPVLCTTNGTPKTFKDGGFLVKLNASFWYIGNNGHGGRSLYTFGMNGSTAMQTIEIAEGVSNMTLAYLPFGGADYLPAASIGSWPQVMAVRMTLTLQSSETVGVDHQALTRQMVHTVYLRNQTQL